MIAGSTFQDTETPKFAAPREEGTGAFCLVCRGKKKGERVFSAQENGPIVRAEGMDGVSTATFPDG